MSRASEGTRCCEELDRCSQDPNLKDPGNPLEPNPLQQPRSASSWVTEVRVWPLRGWQSALPGLWTAAGAGVARAPGEAASVAGGAAPLLGRVNRVNRGAHPGVLVIPARLQASC